MPKVVYVTCPQCGREFYVGREFFEIEESYCHCPYCGQEFKPDRTTLHRDRAPTKG